MTIHNTTTESTLPLARMLATSRFPRAAACIEILALAELFRTATAKLEALAEDTGKCEPMTLRHTALDVVRGLLVELDGQVAL